MLKAVTSVAAGEGRSAPWAGRLRTVLDVRYLAVVTALATYGLIVLGGTVRATDSGLACPDWPLCHGQFIPPIEYHVLIEYSHRVAAASVGFLVLATAVAAWLTRPLDRFVRGMATLALCLLIVQVLVGGVTVNMDLPDTIVAVHLAIALTLLASLIATAAASLTKPRARIAGASLRLVAIAALATLALILTGSYVANAGAALVYPDWPLFDGKIVSSGGTLGDLHYAHRLMAAAVGVVLLVTVQRSWRANRDWPLRGALAVAIVLYGAQVIVGAGNIWFDLATWVRIVHLALASALWGALMFVLAWAYLSQRGREAGGVA